MTVSGIGLTGVLIDSNVLIDILSDDPTWGAWSREALRRASNEAVLVINPVVYTRDPRRYRTSFPRLTLIAPS